MPAALLARIKDTGINRQDLAELIGTSEENISRWIKHGVRPGAQFTEKLCEFLQIDQDDLGALELRTEMEKWRRGPL